MGGKLRVCVEQFLHKLAHININQFNFNFFKKLLMTFYQIKCIRYFTEFVFRDHINIMLESLNVKQVL